MNRWRLLIDEPLSGSENMAVDEAILTACEKGCSPSTIRFYEWDRTTLSLGFFQKADACLKRCAFLDIPVVRRVTGGRAVLHDMELTYSVVTSDAVLLEKGIIGAYKIISMCIVHALMDLGLAPFLINSHKKMPLSNNRKGSESCFDFVSRYEVTICGRKIMGSAQKRLKNSFLQHGSIMMDVDRDMFTDVFGAADVANMDGVNSYIDVDITSVMRALIKRFEYGIGIELISDKLTDFEFDLKEKLVAERCANE